MNESIFAASVHPSRGGLWLITTENIAQNHENLSHIMYLRELKILYD
jgi:hypothetical protein